MSTRKHPLNDRPSIFRRTDQGVPELSEHPDIQESDHPMAPHPGRSAPPRRIKRTFHLPPEDVLLLDELQVADHRRTGRKPELSALVSEAIRLLRDQRAQAR